MSGPFRTFLLVNCAWDDRSFKGLLSKEELLLPLICSVITLITSSKPSYCLFLRHDALYIIFFASKLRPPLSLKAILIFTKLATYFSRLFSPALLCAIAIWRRQKNCISAAWEMEKMECGTEENKESRLGIFVAFQKCNHHYHPKYFWIARSIIIRS